MGLITSIPLEEDYVDLKPSPINKEDDQDSCCTAYPTWPRIDLESPNWSDHQMDQCTFHVIPCPPEQSRWFHLVVEPEMKKVQVYDNHHHIYTLERGSLLFQRAMRCAQVTANNEKCEKLIIYGFISNETKDFVAFDMAICNTQEQYEFLSWGSYENRVNLVRMDYIQPLFASISSENFSEKLLELSPQNRDYKIQRGYDINLDHHAILFHY